MIPTVADLDAPPVIEAYPGEDEPEATHIVVRSDLIESQLTGEAITALCGKRWVPRRDPDDYPLCERCVRLGWEL